MDDDDPAAMLLPVVIFVFGESDADLRNGGGWRAGGVRYEVHLLVVNKDRVIAPDGRNIDHRYRAMVGWMVVGREERPFSSETFAAKEQQS